MFRVRCARVGCDCAGSGDPGAVRDGGVGSVRARGSLNGAERLTGARRSTAIAPVAVRSVVRTDGVLHVVVSGGVPWVAGLPATQIASCAHPSVGGASSPLDPSFGRTCAAVMAHLWRMCGIRIMDRPYTVGKGGAAPRFADICRSPFGGDVAKIGDGPSRDLPRRPWRGIFDPPRFVRNTSPARLRFRLPCLLFVKSLRMQNVRPGWKLIPGRNVACRWAEWVRTRWVCHRARLVELRSSEAEEAGSNAGAEVSRR